MLSAVVLAPGLISSASAQSPTQRGFEPVEQQVEDTDPLSRSLRRVEPGLINNTGQDSRVFRKKGGEGQQGGQGPGSSPRYYYIGRGVVAEFDRSEYVRFGRQGEYVAETIPPNTVFHIGYPPDREQTGNAEQQGSNGGEAPSPRRIDARVQPGGIGMEASTDGSGTRSIGPLHSPGARRSVWETYRRLRQVQQRSVMRAIDRALEEAPGDSSAASDAAPAADRQ